MTTLRPRVFTRPRSSRAGFTLLELAVVVAILGILAAIAIPTYLSQRHRAQDAVAVSAARNMATEGRSVSVEDVNEEIVFPGPDTAALLSALSATEPGYEISASPELSDGPNHVWVWRVPDTDKVAVYAALSESGKCWYVYDFLDAAGGWPAGSYLFAEDNPPGNPPECGRDVGLTELHTELTLVEGPADEPADLPDPATNAALPPCGSDPTCYIGSAWGDPHIVTFDRLAYEFQTIGEYVFVQSLPELEGFPTVLMQLRTGNAKMTPGREVSYTTGAAAQIENDEGTFVVTITPDDDPLRINGDVVSLDSGAAVALSNSDDLSAGYVSRSGSLYRIVWPGPADLTESRPGLDVRVYTDTLNLTPYVTTDYAELVEGLAGNPDDSPHNDLALPGADTVYEIPISNHMIHTTFADAWVVAEEDSLFAANGLTYTPRDATFPSRYVDNPTPAHDFADFDPAEIDEARAFCEAAGVHPNLLLPCQIDYLAAEGNAEREERATTSALSAQTPYLVNLYDNWDQILTFADGQLPNAHGWAAFGHNGTTPSYVEALISGGSLIFNDKRSNTAWRNYSRTDVVTETTTLQADVMVERGTGNSDTNVGFSTTAFGMLVSDGTTSYQVRIFPTHIADGNLPLGTPTALYVTNLHSRKAQLRIVKNATGATLYVDGVEALDLTPGDASALPATLQGNRVAFGQLDVSPGTGKVYFDNIAYTSEDLGLDNMITWAPDPWAQTLFFSDALDPREHGWQQACSDCGTAPSYIPTSFSGGEMIFNDLRNNNAYRNFYLPYTVPTDFTFEADVRVARGTGNNETNDGVDTTAYGLRVSDGTNSFAVRFAPGYIGDGNVSPGDPAKTHTTDLINRSAHVRIAKSGYTAKLYVDGTFRFDLTPVDAAGVNRVAFGLLGASDGTGKAFFDNVSMGPGDLAASLQPSWTPATWLQTLDFSDNQTPVEHAWYYSENNGTAGSYISQSVASGALVFNDHDSNAAWRLYRLRNVVSTNFTFHADVQVTSSPGDTHSTNAMGMRVSDGTDSYWVRLYPTHVADGNAPLGSPTATYAADLESRAAQIRISKSASGAVLYVDGVPALDLTASDAGGTNELSFGFLEGSSGVGRVSFDNVSWSATDLGAFGMTPYNPGDWIQTLTFDGDQAATEKGWQHHRSDSTAGAYVGLTTASGEVVFDDHDNNQAWRQYRMPNTVDGPFAFEADVEVRSSTGQALSGVRIGNGSHEVWVNFSTTDIIDRIGGATYAIDLTSYTTIRVVQLADGSGYVMADGVQVLSLDSQASASNQVLFGMTHGANSTKSVSAWDNVKIGPATP